MLADNDSVKTTLISGDPELCKTFMFEMAVSCAKNGQQIIYFAAKQFESLPPVFHDSSEPSADALKFITFIYTPTYEEISAQLIKLHTYQKPPSVIIVDDLDEFSAHPGVKGCSRQQHVARCCLLILHAASNCSKVLNFRVHVLAASFFKLEMEDLQRVYKIYFDNRWVVTAEPGDSDGDEGRRVWLRNENGIKALEYHRLDDAVLVIRRVFQINDDT